MAKETQAVQQETENPENFASDIVAAFEARVTVVGEIVKDVQELMAGFRGRRETLSQNLQEVLAKNESLRKKDFERIMADVLALQNEREQELRSMLERFRREEETVAGKLKTLLGQGEQIQIKDFKKMIEEIKEEQDKRITETKFSVAEQLRMMQEQVHVMLANFKEERGSVARAWDELLGFFPKIDITARSVRFGASSEPDAVAGETEEEQK